MAQARKSTREADTKSLQKHKELAEAKLATFGLERGSALRFRRVDGGSWHYAKVLGVNKDDSLVVCETHNGAFRSIQVEHCEVRNKGIRGGVKWVPLIE